MPHDIVFLGTTDNAVSVLDAVADSEHFNLAGVITPPDRRAGRGRKVKSPPVAARARELAIPLMQTSRIGSDVLEQVCSIGPEVMLCVAYGAYLPSAFLESAPRGVVNVHPSLLPRFRGAAPVARAIISGDRETGVCFMLLDDRGWDTGPILECLETPIEDEDTRDTLAGRLFGMAADNVESVLLSYLEGRIAPSPQSGDPSYAEKITKEERWLRWEAGCREIWRVIRGLSSTPGARTIFRGKQLTVLSASPRDRRLSAARAPGTITEIGSQGPVIACGEGSIVLTRVKPESRRPMSGEEFIRGYSPERGESMGSESH